MIEVYFLKCTSLFYDTVYQRGLRFSFFDLLFAGFLAFFDFFAAPGFFAFRLPAAAGFAAADFFPFRSPVDLQALAQSSRQGCLDCWNAQTVWWLPSRLCVPRQNRLWRPRAILSHGY